MDKKEKRKLGIIFLLVLIAALYRDFNSENISSENTIARDAVGGESKDIKLLVDVEGVLEEYSYSLEVSPMLVTEEEANQYFEEVVKIIEEDFKNVQQKLPIKESYLSELVTAEWFFSPSGYVKTDGSFIVTEIPADGILVSIKVQLNCGNYEQIYCFPYQIKPENISTEERVIAALDDWFGQQQLKEGSAAIQLPKDIEEYTIKWSEEKEWITWKVFALEAISVFCIHFTRQKQKEQMQKEKILQMEKDYPEVVGQLEVLMEAGMTTRQAWNRIATQYLENRKNEFVEKRFIYEEIVYMNRRITEGEKERVAYQDFGERVKVPCYRRLVRILLGNLEKGNRDVCKHLETESRQAYEQRILLAKRLGEEASTKMLLPLMLMMVLVMIIVMAPAIISFAA